METGGRLRDFIPSLTAEEIYSYDFKIWNWNGKEAEIKDLLYSFSEDELEKMLSLELKDAETEGLYFFEFAGSFFDDVEEALKDRDLELLARWAIVFDYVRLIVLYDCSSFDLREDFKPEYFEKACVLGEYRDFQKRMMKLYEDRNERQRRELTADERAFP